MNCFGDRFVHVTTFDRSARLSRIAERAPDRRARRVFEIRIFEHDHRIFAAEFEHDRRQVFRRRFSHALAGVHAAGEHDLVDTSFDERSAGRSIASDDLQQTFR